MNIENNWLKIQAYKHNGELHREWSHNYVLKDTDDYFVTVSVNAAVTESDGRRWRAREKAVVILFKKKWFNVIAMLKKTGIVFYVNLASPTILDNNYLKYIDYDLDVKLFSNGRIKLLDVYEYRAHANEQHYGKEIEKLLKETVNDIYQRMENEEFPFNKNEIKSLYDEFVGRFK